MNPFEKLREAFDAAQAEVNAAVERVGVLEQRARAARGDAAAKAAGGGKALARAQRKVLLLEAELREATTAASLHKADLCRMEAEINSLWKGTPSADKARWGVKVESSMFDDIED